MQWRILHIPNSHHSQKWHKKLAMDSKTMNKAIHNNTYQLHIVDCLMVSIAKTNPQASDEGQVLFSTIDLRYAYCQLPLDEDTAKEFNFNKIVGQAKGTNRFNTAFYGLTDMPAEFYQKWTKDYITWQTHSASCAIS